MMTGKDVKCPECGTGLVDVAPDYPLEPTPDSDLFDAVRSMHIEAHCVNGHRLHIGWLKAEESERQGPPRIKAWP